MNNVHDELGTHLPGELDAVLGQMFELSLALAGLVESWLADHGLTRARAHIIWLLHHQGPSTQRALARALGVTPRNVTGLLDALETSGYATRTAHPTDRRATLVTLTQAGNAAAAALEAGHHEFARVLFSDLSHTDLSRFSAIARQVIARLRDTDLGGISRLAAGPVAPDRAQDADATGPGAG